MNDQLIAIIQKNTREEIRVGMGEFKGHPLVSIRVWVTAEDLPTKKGLAFSPTLLPDVIAALEAAQKEAGG